MAATRAFRYPIWCRGDLDGFFGLMVDNLVQVLMIVALCKWEAGLSDDLIFGRILPGVGISLIIGNLFYGLQAHWVARRTGNANTTALPYGINTPSVLAFALFIMAPVYRQTGNSDLAWKAGVMACLVSGLIEFFGAFFAEKLRRATPRAALLGVLAAVGITFIAAEFAFRIWTRPLIAIVPMAILLLAYFAQHRFPLRLPGGFLAVLFGTAVAWGVALLEGGGGVSSAVVDAWLGGSPGLSLDSVQKAASEAKWIAPVFCGDVVLELLKPENQGLLVQFLVVSIPMGVLNVIGSLQNIESADAGGDRFATAPSLAVNGIGTIAAGLFGSCFPTTIYIGHPGWKALGARAGYSILNGVFFTAIFLFGLGNLLAAIVPIEAGAAIVMYIGIVITAQAFQATPKAHAPAVVLAIFPALAAIIVVTLKIYLDTDAIGGAATLANFVQNPTPKTMYLPGVITLTGASSTWIVLTLILAAIGASLIDRKYRAAAIWCGVATVLTLAGVLHAYRLDGNVIREYFLWQSRELTTTALVVEEAAPASQPAATPEAAVPTSRQGVLAESEHVEQDEPATASAPTSTPAGEGGDESEVYAYRAFPIAIGYGLATVLFAVVAARGGREEVRRSDDEQPAPLPEAKPVEPRRDRPVIDDAGRPPEWPEE